MSSILKRRKLTLLALLLITPAGFYSKFYQGPAAGWANNSLGGLLYEIFWCLSVYLVFPKDKTWLIALSVLVATCILEFLQLWHPPALEWIRGFFLGRTIIGTSFTWSDFPYYFLGSGLGGCWIEGLRRREQQEIQQ